MANPSAHPQQAHQQPPAKKPALSMPSPFWQFVIVSAVAYGFWSGFIPHFFPPDWQAYVTGIAIAIAGFFSLSLAMAAVHPIHHIQQVIRAYQHSTVHGSARFATLADIKRARLTRNHGLWIGQFEHEVLRFENETHTLVISPAGGGKTVYLVVPQLGLVSMPMLVTDMKGELTAITARWREQRMGHRVRILNPPQSWPLPTDSYNPCDIVIDDLNTDPRDAMSDAAGIAYQLHPEPPRTDGNKTFRDGTRRIIQFVIIALAIDRPQYCNLPTVQSIVANPDELKGLLDHMSGAPDLQGDVASLANAILSSMNTPKEYSSHVNGANQALGPYNPSGRIAQLCSHSSFRFRELQTGDAQGKPVTIYNCCDQSRKKQFESWIGLLNWAAMVELQRVPKQRQVLILMDEASNFTIPELPNMLTALRGYGISVFMVFQEQSEIERVYGKQASDTFWGQADLKIGFGIKSVDTAKRLSELAGERTIETHSSGAHKPGEPINIHKSHTKRPLLTPNEIITLDADRMMVFVKNLPVIMATRCGYHEIEPLRSHLDPNPFHGSQPFRGTTHVSY